MLKQFELSLKFIENKDNYYAGFYAVMEHCALALYIKNCLWDAGTIGDNELLHYSERIHKAKRAAIETHRAWTIARLTESASEHTIETITNSIYNDVFNL